MEITQGYLDAGLEKLGQSVVIQDTEQFNKFLQFFGIIMILWAIRIALLKFLVGLSRSPLAEQYRITKKPVISMTQIERESIWKYGYFYDTVSFMVIYYLGIFRDMPLFDIWGVVLQLIFHATIVEFVYYWWHRILHVGWFYKKFHQYHHKSINTEPTTGLSFEIFERLSYTLLFAVAPALTDGLGHQSILTLCGYFVWFDFMNEGGHINSDLVPSFFSQPPLNWLFYTPSYHAIHHTKFKKNYSLFMPWTDIAFGTALYPEEEKNNLEELPIQNPKNTDFILLVHGGYLSSIYYSEKMYPFLSKFFTGKYEHPFWTYIFYPWLLLKIFYLSVKKDGFYSEETFRFSPKIGQNFSKQQFTGETWIVRNFACHYLFSSYKNLIVKRIEDAVLEAQRQNIRVVGLGNFNKAEWINHGGSDIIEHLKDKLHGTYIAHGDTLSAATVVKFSLQLREQGYWNDSVFITGSTSKIGRAVCLSMANRGIRVVMFSQCKERFDEIASELEYEHRHNLVYANSLSQGISCDFWLTGKMIPYGKELLNAIPKNATVVNFSVPDPLTPQLLKSRPDILHLDSGLLEYDRKTTSPRFTWLLPQGSIYACLAGCIVHSVLGIESHEVGPVKVEDMDKYWDAAMSLGFTIPSPSSFYNRILMPPPRKI